MIEIQIIVPGEPVTWSRAGRNGNNYYTPEKMASWKRLCGYHANKAMAGKKPLLGPVGCRTTAFFGIPPSWPAWKREAALRGVIRFTSTPDGDRLVNCAWDAMNKIVYNDDRQIVVHSGQKDYSTNPRVEIHVFEIEGVNSNITRRDQLPVAP